MNKFIRCMTAAVACAVLFTGCKGNSTVAPIETTTAAGDSEILNFEMPEKGEKIAVINIKDYGEIKVKLFAEEAKAAAPDPAKNAVDNFVQLAEKKYYDELIFHRVIPNFMNQGGDPKGNGTGGNSTWGGEFDGGVIPGLYHFSGAIAYANSSGPSTNKSQFYIVNTPSDYVYYGGAYDAAGTLNMYSSFEEAGINLPQNVKDKYLEVGGVPLLDGGYTVFGQTFEGMDVVRKIGEAETDENDKPLKQIQIESITIEEYQG